jgi:hypothetical protein
LNGMRGVARVLGFGCERVRVHSAIVSRWPSAIAAR